MRRRNILKRIFAVALSVMTLCTTISTVYAETPPPVGNVPIVSEEQSSETESIPEASQPEEPPTDTVTSDTVLLDPPAEIATSSGESQPEPEDTTDEGTPYGEGVLYPYPWENIQCGPDGNPLYGPMLFAAGETGFQGIIECSWMPYTNPSMPDRPNQPWLLVKIGGKIAYCVDPFNHKSEGGVQFVEKNDFNTMDVGIKESIAYIMRYGAKTDAQDADNIYLHMATQTLIWEVVQGQRAPYTMAGSSGGVYQDLAKRYPGFVLKYNQLMNSVVAWGKIPSFASRLILDSPTYALEGSGPYTRTLTNTTAGLNLTDFDFPSTGGVTFSVSGNTLTATASNSVTEETLIKTDRKGATKGNSMIFWFDPATDNQTRSSPGPDPVPAYFKIGAADAAGPDEPEQPEEQQEYYIEISKYETGTDIPLGGAQFEVRYLGGNGEIIIPPPVIIPGEPDEPELGRAALPADSGDGGITEPEHHFVTTVSTDGSGKVKVKVPYSGVYQITETQAPANHKIAEEKVQTVTVNKDTPEATAHVSYHNEPFTGVLVKKIDSVTSQPVAGATIRLEQIDGSIAKEGVTGADGTVSFSDIPAASYQIFEKYAPEGYVLNATVFPVELQANQLVTIVIPNTPKPGLIVRKVDQDGNPLQGAVFTIAEKDGPLICEKISDRNGMFVLENLPKKWITITEKQPPSPLPARPGRFCPGGQPDRRASSGDCVQKPEKALLAGDEGGRG